MSQSAEPTSATPSIQPHDREEAAALARIRAISPEADPRAELPDVHPARIPRHIAVIMDGNGRWAEQRGFPRIFGHYNGARAVREAVTAAGRIGVEVLTLYSFSTENWKRPSDEVRALMELCVRYCRGEAEELAKENVRVRTLGRRAGLPDEVAAGLDGLERATAHCTGPTLCLAINYGSRDEILDAARALAADARDGKLDPDDIDEAVFSGRLTTAGLPDPDLLVRTAGEMRLSNYLLWQLSYAELYVTEVLWPDFGVEDLKAAIRAFAARKRRFGGLDGAADRVAGEAAGPAEYHRPRAATPPEPGCPADRRDDRGGMAGSVA